MRQPALLAWAACAAFASAAAWSQPQAAPAVAPALAQACSSVPATSQDARSLTLKSRSLLAGAIPRE